MASTQYNTSVTFYREVPFDNSYNNSLGAASVANKKAWLDNYSHTEFNDLMTIKVDSTTSRGTIRLNVREDYSHTYNYAYVDDSKTGKYFAFVLGCRYINDGKIESGVQYALYEFDIEVDVVASFLTSDSQLYACPIDRHHGNDSNGFNQRRTAENVPMGDYKYNEIMNAPTDGGDTSDDIDTTKYMIVVAYTGNDDGTSGRTEVHSIQGVPQGMNFKAFNYSAAPSNSINNIETLLNSLTDVSQVLGIYVVPYTAFTEEAQQAGESFVIESKHVYNGLRYWMVTRNNPASADDPYYHFDEFYKLDGYEPHNGKLKMYPFNFGRILNDMGNYTEIRFEDWGDFTANQITGKAIGVEVTAAPPITLRAGPLVYNGYRGYERIEEGEGHYNRIDPNYKVELSNFPLGSFVCDAYQMYVAQNGQVFQDTMAYTGVKTVLGVGMNAAANNWAGAASSLTSGVGSMLDQWFEWEKNKQLASSAADSFSGSSNISNLDFAYERKKFKFTHMSIRSQFARNIDKFFSRYGYSQGGKVGRPVTNSRPYFTYIKTLDECYKPSTSTRCSMSQQKKINEVFLNGCTFWNITNATTSNICDFSGIFNNKLNADMPAPENGGV